MYIQVYTGHNRYVPTSQHPLYQLYRYTTLTATFMCTVCVHPCFIAPLLFMCIPFIFTFLQALPSHCIMNIVTGIFFYLLMNCFVFCCCQGKVWSKQTSDTNVFFFCFSFRFCFCFNRNIYPCMCNMHITVNIYHRVTTSYQKPTKKKKEESEKAGNLHTRDYLWFCECICETRSLEPLGFGLKQKQGRRVLILKHTRSTTLLVVGHTWCYYWLDCIEWHFLKFNFCAAKSFWYANLYC